MAPTEGSLLNQNASVINPKKTPQRIGKKIFKTSVQLEETFTGLAIFIFLAKIMGKKPNYNLQFSTVG